MANGVDACAKKVISAFKDALSEQACTAIGDNGFDVLNQIVRETLSAQRLEIAAKLSDYAETLRAGADKPELGL